MLSPIRATLLATAVGLALLSGCTPSSAYCQKREECASDPPGRDFVEICTIQADGQLRSLRANKEEECLALADAVSALNACLAQLDCDDFNEGDRGGECEDERDDYQDALEDAEDDCSSLD